MVPDVWVSLEVEKQGSASVIRGRASRAEVDAWARGERAGSLTLQDAYWVEPGGSFTTLGLTPGLYASATGTVLLRADRIASVTFLRDGSERTMLGMQASGAPA